MFIDPHKLNAPKLASGLLLASFVIHFLIRPDRAIHSPWHYAGILFFMDGLSLLFWSHKLFRRSGTSVHFEHPPTKLITEGLYEKLRNPMYAGLVISTLGIAIFMGTWPFLLNSLILFLILERIYIPMEEDELSSLFKEEYSLYKSKSRRWV